jgi:hypothetical protein
MSQTLPEVLVGAIKSLVAAHRDYVAVVEELQALGQSFQGDLDRLVSRQEKLADISLVSKAPMVMPKAIVPVPREAEGAA